MLKISKNYHIFVVANKKQAESIHHWILQNSVLINSFAKSHVIHYLSTTFVTILSHYKLSSPFFFFKSCFPNLFSILSLPYAAYVTPQLNYLLAINSSVGYVSRVLPNSVWLIQSVLKTFLSYSTFTAYTFIFCFFYWMSMTGNQKLA